MDITELLFYTKKNNASDLHLSAACVPAVRVHGDIMRLKMDPLPPEQVRQMIYSIMTDAQRAEYEREMEIDFAVQFGQDTRFRVNAFNTLQGAAASFRVIPTHIHNIEDLRLPEVVRHLSQLDRGLVLVTGPTGSGKSTTLAAMIDYINQNMAKHIITVEDPIEFVYPEGKALINQRELESSTKSFARALKSALRQDPDVILVGELRDLETIELALTAAETGHLVFGTLHTNSASKTIDRIVDVFPSHDKELIRSMLSTSLEAVISQKLLRRKDKAGRVAALEILMGTSAVRNLIRENRIPQIHSLIQVGSKHGMQTMKDSAYALIEQGLVDLKEVQQMLNEQYEVVDDNGLNNRQTQAQRSASSYTVQDKDF